MTRALILIGFVWFIAIVAFIAWWAGRKDERIDTTDCFSRYRLHVHDCDECRPPDVRCAVGVALRHEAVETFTDKQMEARAQ